MAKATTTKTTATQADATVTNLSNEALPPLNGDEEIAVGELKSEATASGAVIAEDNNPTIETYSIAHAEDDTNAAPIEAVAVDVADLSADKQATIQPISQADTAKSGSYKAQWQLRHNGKVYNEGDNVELSEDDAKALLETGVIVKAE